jgi:hypothetical protein
LDATELDLELELLDPDELEPPPSFVFVELPPVAPGAPFTDTYSARRKTSPLQVSNDPRDVALELGQPPVDLGVHRVRRLFELERHSILDWRCRRDLVRIRVRRRLRSWFRFVGHGG